MKRSFSFGAARQWALVVAGTCLIAGTYGLVRLAYGLFLPDIQASVSMGSAVAGYVSTGASVAYCAGALAGLAASQRPRLLVAGALMTASIGSIGMAVAADLSTFAPSAVLASTGAGLASPGLVAIVERNLPAGRVDRAQATVNAGTGPGLVAAGLLALLLTQWRLGFAAGATFTAVAGSCVLLLDRRDRDRDRSHPGSAPGPSTVDSRWLAVLVVPATAAVLLGAASAAVWTYGRAHLVSAGASGSASTVAWIAIGVGGTATVLSARLLSAREPSRAWLLSTSVVAIAVAALGLAPDRYRVAALACGVFGWGFVAASSALIAWATQLVPDRAAPGTSVLFISLVLGQAAGSAAVGAVSGGLGMSTTFVLAAVVALAAAACALAPTRPRGAVAVTPVTSLETACPQAAAPRSRPCGGRSRYGRPRPSPGRCS
jgi:predicted MFS family arabinose efflux permease